MHITIENNTLLRAIHYPRRTLAFGFLLAAIGFVIYRLIRQEEMGFTIFGGVVILCIALWQFFNARKYALVVDQRSGTVTYLASGIFGTHFGRKERIFSTAKLYAIDIIHHRVLSDSNQRGELDQFEAILELRTKERLRLTSRSLRHIESDEITKKFRHFFKNDIPINRYEA